MTAQEMIQPIEAPIISSEVDRPPLTASVTKPLKICLLGYRSAPFVGGQGIYINYLSKALADAGHSVDVISGQPYPHLDPRVKLIKMPSLDLFEAESHAKALKWHHLKSFSDTFEWWSMLTGGFSEPYTFSRRAAKYLKKHANDYDLVHDNQCLGHGMLKIQRRIPLVTTIHHPITRDRELALAAAPNWQHRLMSKRWYNFLNMQTKVARKLDHVITVSEKSRKDISEAFDRPEANITLMYNGIDTEVFRPMPAVEPKPMRIITTASADQPLKGLRYLLAAIARLKPSYPDLELRVIGKLNRGGPTFKQLRKLGLESSVSFLSGISTEDLVKQYNKAAIAVSPSLYEGFGLPAGEAMACGTAVISSDGGALPEVVGEAGVIVPAGNSKALAEAIKQYLENPENAEQLAKAGRQRILDTFSWQVKAQQLTRYYHDILDKNSTITQ